MPNQQLRDACYESDAVERVNRGDPAYPRYWENHLLAADLITIAAEEKQVIHPRVLHRVLFNGIPWLSRPGEYRDVGVYIRRANLPDLVFPKPELVPRLMEQWWQGPLLDPWESHSHFESIHPFVDGNGRVGRLVLWNMQLMFDHNLTVITPDGAQAYYEELDAWRSRNS